MRAVKSGWRKFFTLAYWRIQLLMLRGIGRPLNIVSVFRIELPNKDEADA